MTEYFGMMQPQTLIREIDAVARRIRAAGIASAVAATLRAVVALASGCVLLDAALRFPQALRWVILAALVACAVLRIRGKVRPALRARPGSVHLALELERRLPASAGVIASGLEFASDPAWKDNQLAAAVAGTAARSVPPHEVRALLTTKRLKQELCLVGALALGWMLAGMLAPSLASTGAIRLLAPWIAAEWPARTELRSSVVATHHPRQRALPLGAELVRGDVDTDVVWVRLRRIQGGVHGPWERMGLVHQGQRRFERMVEANGDAIEFQFLTEDVSTPLQQIAFGDAPAVVDATLEVTPPAYATGLERSSQDLGNCTGRSGRATEPVLEGSACTLALAVSEGAVGPGAFPGGTEEWLRRTVEWKSADGKALPQPGDLACTEDGQHWSIRWTAQASSQLEFVLVDRQGVENVEPIEVVVDVRADEPPEPAVTLPVADETVLASAAIPLTAIARDDVGIDEVHLDASCAKRWQARLATASAGARRDAEVSTVLEIASSGAGPGDVIEVVAVASDRFESQGLRRPPATSPPRRLKVVSEEQFAEENRTVIAAVRQAAVRTGERQRGLLERDDPAAQEVRPQAEVGERIAAMGEMIGDLRRRLQQNNATDQAMESLLDAAEDIAGVARQQSDSARNTLQEAAAEADGAKAQSLQEQASAAQREVESELADLAGLLDRDREAWAATQRLEKVAEAITRADAERTKAGARTIGKSEAELDAQQAAELERAAEATRSAAQAAREAMDDLRQRAERVASADPVRAESLKQAVARGESESLQSRMEQAERSTRANKMDAAQQASAGAMQTVQRMMEDLKESQARRAQSLKRRLAGLAQSLEQVLREAESAQESVVGLLGAADADVALGGQTAARQASDVAVNAAAVADQARGAGPSVQRVVRLVERGSEAEIRAAQALLAAPVDLALGQEQSSRATALFREALDAVRQQERRTEEQERQQRARELARKFLEIADRQEGLWTATTALVGGRADRRSLVEARRLGVDQESIGQSITEVVDGSEDVRKSAALVAALDVAREESSGASDELRQGLPTAATTQLQGDVLSTLRGIADALQQASKAKDDPFQEEGGQGAGGGGGNSGGDKPAIPPLAELKVLRSLQERIYEGTKLAATTPATAARVAQLVRRQESLATLTDELRKEVERQMQERGPRLIEPVAPEGEQAPEGPGGAGEGEEGK